MAVATFVDTRLRSTEAPVASPPLTDARPLIPRNDTNLWTQAEKVRDELYRHFEDACRAEGIHPLLLTSGPYAFPAWIKFEAWQPQDLNVATQRSSAVITIDPKPFHSHPFEFEITYEAQSRKRTIKRVMPLDSEDVQKLVRYLLHGGRRPRFARFRDTALQLWREKNELEGLRRDWLAIFLGICVVAGFTFMALLPIALVFWGCAALLYTRLRKRTTIVRIDGKPNGEPRSLIRVDSWQTVLFNLGAEEAPVRERFVRAVQAGIGERCRFGPERVWYWGLDGKEEREQLVLVNGRGLVFCQIYRYGYDLYVGWDGHLNRGQWVEQTVASGIDDGTGNPVTITRVVPGTQPTSEYDLADLSCLMEWTHAQVVKLLKKLIEERKIDQEIDFKIQRAEREKVVTSGAASPERTGRARNLFQRTA